MPWLHTLLDRKYYFDEFNQRVFARGGVGLGKGLWKHADAGFIDGLLVNGSAGLVARTSGLARKLQTGFLYHYAFAMIIGVLALVGVWVLLP